MGGGGLYIAFDVMAWSATRGLFLSFEPCARGRSTNSKKSEKLHGGLLGLSFVFSHMLTVSRNVQQRIQDAIGSDRQILSRAWLTLPNHFGRRFQISQSEVTVC